MPSMMTLPIIAVLSVTGAVGGVLLGRSAIADINPAYYTDVQDYSSFAQYSAAPPSTDYTWPAAAPASDYDGSVDLYCPSCGRPETMLPDESHATDVYVPPPARHAMIETPPLDTISPAQAEIEPYTSYRVAPEDEEQAPPPVEVAAVAEG